MVVLGTARANDRPVKPADIDGRHAAGSHHTSNDGAGKRGDRWPGYRLCWDGNRPKYGAGDHKGRRVRMRLFDCQDPQDANNDHAGNNEGLTGFKLAGINHDEFPLWDEYS